MGSDDQSLLRMARERARDLAGQLQRRQESLATDLKGRAALERSIDSAARLAQSIDRALTGVGPPSEEPER